ncbi:helix-turn-helix domain-containing protein [Streptomyces sp. NPDC096153]|uniref:helix-turn-helix domain-containing protein n=1 Tax=Streptomyces sp. NPDC096153 TaxID=3155548 RepID=UPI00331FCD45
MTEADAVPLDESNSEDLAALLARLVEETPGKTQKDLAREVGISYPTLNAWLNRKRGMSRVHPETLRTLAAVLRRWGADVTEQQLFEAIGRPVPGPSDEESEERLLAIYRQLSVNGQKALLEHARLLQRSSRS